MWYVLHVWLLVSQCRAAGSASGPWQPSLTTEFVCLVLLCCCCTCLFVSVLQCRAPGSAGGTSAGRQRGPDCAGHRGSASKAVIQRLAYRYQVIERCLQQEGGSVWVFNARQQQTAVLSTVGPAEAAAPAWTGRQQGRVHQAAQQQWSERHTLL
jgi:hypothetical protein